MKPMHVTNVEPLRNFIVHVKSGVRYISLENVSPALACN
jgi:hypothetical protein